MSTAVAALPKTIEEWTQEQRDSLLTIAKRTLAGYGKYHFSREFIARHVDDFVQDALLQAWVSQQDPDAESLRVYNPAGFVSFKVVQLALDKAKGEKLRLERAAPDGAAAGEQGALQTAAERVSDPVRTDEVHELAEHLKATKLAMAQLSERQRVAFVKCQLEGRSQTEVAEELSEAGEQPVTRKAVERLVANARVSLSVAFAKVASGAFCEEQRQLLELVDKGWASPEQEREAHAHLEDCAHCAQVRAYARFERNAGLAAISLPGFGASDPGTTAIGLLDGVQHLAGAAGERLRDLAVRLWPFGSGAEAGGVAVGGVTTTKAVVAICVAAGGTGACVNTFSQRLPETPRPAPHKERSAVRQSAAHAAASESAPSEAAPSPVAESRGSLVREQEASASASSGPKRKPRPSDSPPPSGQAPQSEFGFEGSSPPAAGSGKGRSAAVTSRTTLSPSGAAGGAGAGSANQDLSPTPSGGGAGPAPSAGSTDASGGAGSAARPAAGKSEFGLAP